MSERRKKLDGFDQFWAIYPRRVAKKDAERVWVKLDPSVEMVNRMIEAVTWQANTSQWRKDGGAYVPYPATWLRGERWLDERVARAVAPSYVWRCPHAEPCSNRAQCDNATLLNRPRNTA